mmetsp:Transcript_15105/g.21971  ORF Transcript_15105/g.21971 Transcript_15105/m.21971 type:complete len:303 (+) Transcript_15105:72-980(+)
MQAEQTTPQKTSNLSYGAHRTFSECIFSTSEHKRHRSRLSERRYTPSHDSSFCATKENEPEEVKSGKLLTFTNEAPPPAHHRRNSSHQRKPSIYLPSGLTHHQILLQISQPKKSSLKEPHSKKNSKIVSFCSEVENLESRQPSTQPQSPKIQNQHVRNASDADSVIYMGPDEEKKIQELYEDSLETYNSQILSEKNSPKLQECSPRNVLKENNSQNDPVRGSRSIGSVRGSLPVLGMTPCSAYCNYCKQQVHTKVEYQNPKLPSPFLTILSNIFTCCQAPNWLSTHRVHACPNCNLVIAKSR